MKTLCVPVGVLIALVLSGSARAEPIVIGLPPNPDASNVFPFGGVLVGETSSRYQQVYSSGVFSGQVLIKELQFYMTVDRGGLLNVGTFEFSLSTTSRPVDGLDTRNFAANIGVDNRAFAVVSFTGAPAQAVLSIPGAPFLYNPAAGNLLLDVIIPGGATHLDPDNFAPFDAHNAAGGIFSRAHDFGIGFAGYGLVTGFLVDPVPIPEPGSLLLVSAGVSVLVARRRSHRRPSRLAAGEE